MNKSKNSTEEIRKLDQSKQSQLQKLSEMFRVDIKASRGSPMPMDIEKGEGITSVYFRGGQVHIKKIETK